MKAMGCTLRNPRTVRDASGARRTFSRHQGGPCEAEDCLFRRPILRAEAPRPTPLADEIREQARLLREELQRETREAAPAPPPARPVLTSLPHFCHVTECKEPCPRAHLMCPRHWRAVPLSLRRAVLDAYQRGQEQGLAPVTEAYLTAARAAIAAVSGKPNAVREEEQLSLFGKT